MAHSKTIDHVLLNPQGRVNVAQRLSTANARDRKKAANRSERATTILRAKLRKVQIVMGEDSSWLHVVGDRVVARFASATDAVAAL